MKERIPLREGEYLAEQAFLVAADNRAAALENAVLEIYLDRRGEQQVKGSGMVLNVLVIELLEDSDDIDLVYNLGRDYIYRFNTPDLKAGKVFAPDVKSNLQFVPTRPWQRIPPPDFEALRARLQFL